ncbi:hypothetical protein CK215_15755 [Mesorhizobium sp. WSM3864]|nr:hypothetical protein CK215_15755 [Mesorhizobium sp. WSM3864]
MAAGELEQQTYDVDAPIRLELAARSRSPMYQWGVKDLRRERDAGRLTTEKVANKEYTTLSAIGRMRELCRVQPKRSVSPPSRVDPLGSAQAEASLEIARAAALELTLQMLR